MVQAGSSHRWPLGAEADFTQTGLWVICPGARLSSLCPTFAGQAATIHGIPAKGAKMDATCANCERHLAFLPSCASLYCEEPDDAPAVARCFAGGFGREPKGEPR
jgi:hypothetical protein